MQNLMPEPEVKQEVAILLFERFSNHCLANAVEPLRAVNSLLMREAYRWRFVTLDGNAVNSSSGLPVMPNCRLRDHPGGQFLWVLSSYDVQKFTSPAYLRALRAACARFECVAGFDTGAWLLAACGLLDGKTATIHWDEMTAFSETFPEVTCSDQRFVIDDRVMTCGGAMTAFDLALELIGRTHGPAIALEVAAFFLHHSADAPSPRLFRRRASILVESAMALMSRHLETPITIGDIATHLAISQPVLGRAFQSELGASPKAVYKRLRLAAARRYVQQSSYSIAEIALRCGYQSPASMTRAFVEEHGKPPSAFRAVN